MTQIIISNLESNVELDRQALSSVLGGKRKGGFRNHRKNGHHRGRKFGRQQYQVEYYREYYSASYYNDYDYGCYTPKFKHYGCFC